jgi:TetR/AcrR family transcriptional regulator, transcriptional repressor for nem operon
MSSIYLPMEQFESPMDIREAILSSAEARIRAGGYHACSFREIASDVGIKSASVHYYFPTKAELGAALVARYQARFLAEIGSPDDQRGLAAKLNAMRSAFRDGLARGDGMCLCGVLATEMRSLPSPVTGATQHYFIACNDWLHHVFARAHIEQPERKALQVTALLQGAMLQAIALEDVGAFDAALEAYPDLQGRVGSKRKPAPRRQRGSAKRRREEIASN